MKKMRPSLHFLFAAILAITSVTIQAQTIYRTVEFDFPSQTGYNTAHVTTFDGGAAILCWTYSATTSYFSIIKTQSNGGIQWSRRINAVSADFENIVQCPDSGYFFCYANYSEPCTFEALKYDKNGNLVFCKRIDAPSGYVLGYNPVSQVTGSGNFYVASTLFNIPTSGYTWNLFELDGSGNMLWSHNYHQLLPKSFCFDIDTSLNGDIMLLGSAYDTVSGTHGAMVDRLSPTGAVLWSKKYFAASASMEWPYCFTRTAGDRFNIASKHVNTLSSTTTTASMKIDGTGNVIWSFIYTGTDAVPYTTVTGRNNESYIICQDQMTNSSFLIRVDSAGLPLCARRYNAIYFLSLDTMAGADLAVSALMVPPAYKIALVTVGPCGAGCNDVAFTFGKTPINITVQPDSGVSPMSYVVTDDTLSIMIPVIHLHEVCNTVGISETHEGSEIQFYPSPADDAINVNCPTGAGTVDVIDVNGRVIRTTHDQPAQFSIYTGDLAPGVYFVRLSTGNEAIVSKIIVAH